MKVPVGFHRLVSIRHRLICMHLCRSATAFTILLLFFCHARPAKSADSADLNSAFFGRIIRRIAFSSDVPLNRSHYDAFIGVQAGDLLTRTAIKTAIQRLHDYGRFSSIAVDAFPDNDGVVLQFRLRHNYYFNRFTLAGNIDLKGRSLWESIPLPIGQRYTAERLEESRKAVLTFVKERGFYLAEVSAHTVANAHTRQIDTTFSVQPGDLAKIDAIDISGVPPQNKQELLDRFEFRPGQKFDRSRLNSQLENLRKYLLDQGYLAATVEVSESLNAAENKVHLTLNVINLGKMRVVVEGYKIDKNKLHSLLPILTGEGITPEILEEGAENLKKYLDSQGYADAEVEISETVDASGVRVFHHKIDPRRKFSVAYVHFNGNQAIPGKELLSVIAIQPATFQNIGYSSTQLEDAIDSLRALYESRGYRNAEVTSRTEPVKEGAKLGIVFLIKEGPQSQLHSLNISGNKAIAFEDLKSRMHLMPGAPYSPSIVEKARQALLSAYNDLGYLQAQATVHVGEPIDENSYPVEIRIVEGAQSFVDHLLILGNERTRNSVIQKRIKLKESEPLSLSRILQTQQGLYALGVFDQVRVAQQNPDSTAPYQDVVIRMEESKRFTMRYGLGYQEREKLRGTVEFTDLNILGTARRADIRLRGSSIEQQAIFNLKQPQLRAIPVESYFTFSALQRRDVSFDSRRFSLSYQFSHPYGNNTWSMLRYNFKNVRILKSLVSTSDLGREDEPVNLSTFSTAFIRDTRDDFLDPTKGFFSSTDFGVTTKLLGDNDYLSFYSQTSYFRPLPKSFLLAGSVRIGAVRPFGGDHTVPISERFFAGGGSSLRGFDTDYAGPLDPLSSKPLGGNALIIGSLEMRMPVFRFVQFAGFYDGGDVFDTISNIKFSGFSHTVGGGLRIRTPFGPLRADYGYNLNLSEDLRQRGLKRGHLFITVGPPF